MSPLSCIRTKQEFTFAVHLYEPVLKYKNTGCMFMRPVFFGICLS